jgi:MFS family permease
VGRALQHRNYRLFFSGQLVSLIGTWTQSVAQTWLVYRLTGSALLLGTITFCQQAPIFVFATLGGAVADRFPRRTVLVLTQCAAMTLAFVLAALTLGGSVKLTHIFVIAALLGVVNAVDIPTRQSFVGDMVDRENLMNAVALNSSMVNGARIVGPAIAGFAIRAFGEGWCFVVNGLSFVAVIVGLLAMRDLPVPAPKPETSAIERVLEGFRFVGDHARVRSLFVLFGVTALVGMPYSTLLPVFASKVFHGDAHTLGMLMGATGVGALVGTLTLAARRKIAGIHAWIGAACVIFGATIALFALSRTLWLSMLILVPLGTAMMIQMSATNTLVQTMTPAPLRGRVMAIWAMIFMGMSPFGALLAGALATAIGPTPTLVGEGVACALAATAFVAWSWRSGAWLDVAAERVSESTAISS